MFTWSSRHTFLKKVRQRPSFVIDQLVPSTGVTILFGPPSCGKSTMLWTMAECIFRGEKFLGRYQTSRALTLLLNLDMPGYAIQDKMIKARYKPCFDICDFQSHINITTLQKDNPAKYMELAKHGSRHQVIMVDTLSTITTGMSLKDDWVPGLTISTLRTLFPTQAIILLHHSRKQQMGPFGPIPPHREDALGSNLWMAMSQSHLQMYLKGDHLSHLRMAKSQVAPLGEGDDVYVDDTGCRVLPYLPHDHQQWLMRLGKAEQTAALQFSDYKTKSLGDRYKIIGNLLTPQCSDVTVRRWIKRSSYQMI